MRKGSKAVWLNCLRYIRASSSHSVPGIRHLADGASDGSITGSHIQHRVHRPTMKDSILNPFSFRESDIQDPSPRVTRTLLRTLTTQHRLVRPTPPSTTVPLKPPLRRTNIHCHIAPPKQIQSSPMPSTPHPTQSFLAPPGPPPAHTTVLSPHSSPPLSSHKPYPTPP